MVTDELRKKWGTIFMGDREASLEQIDAMQEPIFRERNRKEQEQNYLDRVKQRATDRAKAILGEAYAERQKILEEARAEAASAHGKLLDQAKQIQLQAQEELNLANQEVAKAREIRQDAELIREQAHEDGYQAGIAQANEELKVFRGEMGQGFASILQLVDAEIGKITSSWREDLVLLVQTAITAATGWVLDTRHEAILRALVVEAVTQLEQREIITVRVNPQDEALVSDMFKAAREKAPEIKQWVVNADDTIECGGLVAESGSGSVDCRREHFRELVEGILVHLTLPEGEADIARAMQIHDAVNEQAQAFLPPVEEETSPAATDEALYESVAPSGENIETFADSAEAQADVVDPPVAESSSDEVAPLLGSQTADSLNDATEFAPSPDFAANDLLPDEILQNLPEDDIAPVASGAEVSTPSLVIPEEADPVENADAQVEPDVDVPEAWLPPLGEAAPGEVAQESDIPSLSELEDELFPLDESEDSKVLTQGGFLSGDTNPAG